MAHMPSPTWVATTPQLRPRAKRWREPWKIVHARRDGTFVTACDLPCGQWYSLWDLPLDLRSPVLCRDCILVLRQNAA
jgi:hypothetical protein